MILPSRAVRPGEETYNMEQYTENQQSGDLVITEAVDTDGGVFQLRHMIHIDSSYPRQSSAKCEVWHQDSLAWHNIVTFAPVEPANYKQKREAAYATASLMRDEAVGVLEQG